ncbi:MAG TPA: ATP-binding protein [Chthoniobacterales bacterium]|jgi:two-component system phosphate regulon sensor histidine kinase PhoR|nr:ATP-binding protein [Chthoniobacterales bacterium]
MGWIAFSVLAALVVVAALAIWRKWISPWDDADELAAAVLDGREPRKFLISGNPQARRVGLALEKLKDIRGALETRVAESEMNVQTVFGAMPDGLAVVDERRNVRLMNREFRRLFALPDDISSGTLLELSHNASIDRLTAKAIASQQLEGEPVNPSRGGGEPQEMEVTAVPIMENARGHTGAVVLLRDVSHFRKVEQMRRDFVANVSHELRTPLSILRGYLETLLDDPHQSPGELLRILEVMERHSDRLNALVEDVLSLARLESPGIELNRISIDLSEFLHSIMRDWEKRFADRQLKSHLNFPGTLPPLDADETRLQELIYNLLDNAVKYSKPGGTIFLRAESAGESIRITLADQGIGISPIDLPRIFERFYRADKSRGGEERGTGLGLSIVKHIAHLHGGTVEAESEPGKGTTLSVTLPAHHAAAAVTQT